MKPNKSNLIVRYIFPLVLGILLAIGVCVFYINPQRLMTDTAKALTGKELVDAENAVRGNVLYVAGAIFVLGTLWINVVQTGIAEATLKATMKQLDQESKRGQENINIALQQLKLERDKFINEQKKEWKNKVEQAYLEWAEAFLSGTSDLIHIVRYRKHGEIDKKEEAKKDHSYHHFIRQKVTFKILMLEQREKVREIFNEINQYPYPHYPILQSIEDKKEKEKAEKIFWDIANRDDQIIGYFYGTIKERLTKFCDWITAPDEEFEMPDFEDYKKYVEERIPALKRQ